MASVGGSTALSEGRMLAAGSYVQKALGIEDTPELFAEYLMNISQNKADPEFVRIVAESSAATIDWLVGFGVQFADEAVTPVPDMQPNRGLFPVDKREPASSIRCWNSLKPRAAPCCWRLPPRIF